MNKKGQALLEFVIILPIFFIIVLFLLDFSNIFYNKIYLENQLNNYVNDNKVNNDINYKKNITREYIEITLSKDLKLLNPILKEILTNPYNISTSVILYE